MTAITTNPPATTSTQASCGTDCIIIDGQCRCYYGESTSRDFGDPALNDLVPPF